MFSMDSLNSRITIDSLIPRGRSSSFENASFISLNRNRKFSKLIELMFGVNDSFLYKIILSGILVVFSSLNRTTLSC